MEAVGLSDRYDIAFSLLNEDEPKARRIAEALDSAVDTFLYSLKQRELMMERDGLEAFPGVFRGATLCAILYRSRWGETPWTRLEKAVIGDRFLQEGPGFLSLIRLDDTSDIPQWFPRSELWMDLGKDSPEAIALHLQDRLSRRLDSANLRITRRTFDRRPVPIARYQQPQSRVITQYLATKLVVCDGCTAGVQYRTVSRVILGGGDDRPATEENLCPPCARRRGISVVCPPGMTSDELYAEMNPTFSSHVRRLFRQGLLRTVEQRVSDIASRVYAAASTESFTLVVRLPSGEERKIDSCFRVLEAADVRSEVSIVDYCVARVREAINSVEADSAC